MTDREAMKMALEALEKDPGPLNAINNAQYFLRQALAQPEQKNSIWVLTREINDYNQDGEYFVAAWNKKPTHEMLKEIMGVQNADHVLAGGGRIKWENEWFYLKEQA